MNDKNLFRILSEIDENYILEAADYKPSRHKRLYNRRVLAAILAAAIIVGSIVLLGQVVLSNERFNFRQMGSRISEINRITDSEILYEEHGITLTCAEVQKRILGLQSNAIDYSNENITEVAIKGLLTTKAMIAKANENGYSTSEEEFEAFKQKSIDNMNLAENKDQAMEYMDGFGGVEAYFSSMKGAIMDGLTMNKYLDDLEKDYAEELGMDIMDYDFYTIWLDKEEEIKEAAYEELNISSEEMHAMAEHYETYASEIEDND